MVYFSKLKGGQILDKNKKEVGVLKDLVFVDGTKYADITHIVYCCSDDKSIRKIPFVLVEDLKEILEKDKGGIIIELNESIGKIIPFFLKDGDAFRLSRRIQVKRDHFIRRPV